MVAKKIMLIASKTLSSTPHRRVGNSRSPGEGMEKAIIEDGAAARG
jgi:hypothetical protein